MYYFLLKACLEINKINSSSCAALLPLKDNFTQKFELCDYLLSHIVADCLHIIVGCRPKIQLKKSCVCPKHLKYTCQHVGTRPSPGLEPACVVPTMHFVRLAMLTFIVILRREGCIYF